MRPAAGWYPDAHDRDLVRWWDGSRWTERTHSAAGAVPAVDDARQRPEPTVAAPAVESPAVESPVVGSPAAESPVTEPSWPTPTWTPAGQPRLTKTADAGSTDPRATPLPLAPPPSTPPLSTIPPGSRPAPGFGSRPQAAGELAAPGRRLAARLIDGTVMLVLTMICTLPWTADYMTAVRAHMTPESFDLKGLVDDPGFMRYANAQALISLIVHALYEIPLIRYYGATPGKRLLGVRVQPVDGEGPVNWVTAIARWALWMPMGQFTANLWLILDGGWCLFDRRRQCLHDKFVRTVVVNASADTAGRTQPPRR